jgi:small neutral amino acid transporter SnatA (MarC family)
MNDILEKITAFIEVNPQYMGIFYVAVGVFMLLAAIKNWEWVFGGHSFNLKKIQGISKMFGRSVARIVAGIFGLFCIFFGIWWFVVHAFYYQ